MRRKGDIVHGVRESRNNLHLCPTPRILTRLEDEHFALCRRRAIITPRRDHRGVQPEHALTPGQAGKRKLAADLVLQRPLRQIHDVRRLVDADHAVRRASGQQKSLVLRRKLHVRHTRSCIDEIRALHPPLDRCHRRGRLLGDRLFPDHRCAVKGTRREDLAELRMRPSDPPHGARVCLPTGRHAPSAIRILVPDLGRKRRETA